MYTEPVFPGPLCTVTTLLSCIHRSALWMVRVDEFNASANAVTVVLQECVCTSHIPTSPTSVGRWQCSPDCTMRSTAHFGTAKNGPENAVVLRMSGARYSHAHHFASTLGCVGAGAQVV